MPGSTLLAIVLSAVGLAPAVARRDTGDDTGVARDVRGDVRGIAGRLEETVIGTCAATTGRAVEGVHLVLALADGQRAEVHLGPCGAIEELLAAVDAGDEVRAEIFRTDAMPLGAFAAVTVTVEGETIRLRGDDLRPRWAARRGAEAGGGAARAAAGGARCWWDLRRDRPPAPPAFEMPSAAVATLHDASAGAVSRRAAWASSPVPDRAGARSRSTSALAVKSS